jgi:hypothetical protein
MKLPLTLQQQLLCKYIGQYPDWRCEVPYAFCLTGSLSVELLERSLGEVVRRHGSLRSRVLTIDNCTGVEVIEPGGCPIEVVHVAGRTRAEMEADAAKVYSDFASGSTNEVAHPLLRVKLLKLADGEHWLLLAIHRLIADCFSAEQVFEELWVIYRELSHGRPSPLETDAPQYGDYACWQQAQGSDWLQKHERYWNDRLAGAQSVHWPMDARHVLPERGATGIMSIHFGSALSEDLRAFARRTRSLAAMVMLSVYVALLWKWCGQRDFVLPFYVAGRQSEHKAVVGYFSHVLYLRIQLTGQERFSELLRLISNEFFRALAHQDFGKQSAERPELLAGTFCQWVTWHTNGAAATASPPSTPAQLQVERLPLGEFGQGLSILPPGMVEVDLTFFDTTQGVYAQGVYRADHFRQRTADRLMQELRSATGFFLQNPEADLPASFEQLGGSEEVPSEELVPSDSHGF